MGNLRPAVDALVLITSAGCAVELVGAVVAGAAHRWLANITVSSGIKPP